MIDGSGLMKHSLTMTGFDPCLLTNDQLLQQVHASSWFERVGFNNRLITAATWADRHPADSIDPYQLAMPGGDRPIRPGGDGTPELARFCLAEYATTLGKATGTAERIIADGLDLRHRLPRLWIRLCNYEIDGLDCQTIARHTRHLTLEQALQVDASVADLVGRWSFGRLMNHLEAKIIEVDAENVKKLAEQAAQDVGVWLGQSNEHGIKALYLRAKSPAVIRFYAQAGRIADILLRRGHTGTKDQRLADAIDILANPLDAIRMIAEDTEPTLFDPDPDDDSLLPRPAAAGPDGEAMSNPAGESPTGSRSSDVDHDRPTDTHSNSDPAGARVHDQAADAPSADDASADDATADDHDIDEDMLPPDLADGCTDTDDSSCRFPRIDQHRWLAEQAIRAIGQIDPAKFRPDATLYVHIAQETLQTGLGVTRVEDIGPIVSSLVADWLTDCNLTLKPVIDLSTDLTPADAYEIPRAMRERMFLKHPTSVFPFSGSVGRQLDLDHNIPYTPGIPGQTREDNLGPNGRGEHNVITHGYWQRRQPEPGTYLFRAPHGRLFLVNQTGSHDLGCGPFAQHVWHAAMPTPHIA